MERQPRRRRRAALACLQCRLRKIKCDRNDPCAHCVSSRAHCAYNVHGNNPGNRRQLQEDICVSIPSSSTHVPSPLAQIQQPRAARSTTEGEPYLSRVTVPAIRRQTAELTQELELHETPGRSDGQPLNDTQQVLSDVRELLRRVQRLEQSSVTTISSSVPTEADQQISTRQLTLQDSHVVLNKTRIMKWSDWKGGPEVPPLPKQIFKLLLIALPAHSRLHMLRCVHWRAPRDVVGFPTS
jgi:hypothetical protein